MKNELNETEAEKQLAILIKESGEEARKRRKKLWSSITPSWMR